MRGAIEQIIEWNKIAQNNDFKYGLEASMIAEEFAEFIQAIKNNDKVEAVDGILDMFIIGIGTLHKMGINAEQIENCFDDIMRANYSKFEKDGDNFICIKNEIGKIQKAAGYKAPDLKQFIK